MTEATVTKPSKSNSFRPAKEFHFPSYKYGTLLEDENGNIGITCGYGVIFFQASSSEIMRTSSSSWECANRLVRRAEDGTIISLKQVPEK